MSYNEGENGISIVDALFMEDSVGMCLFGSGQVFDFMVVAFIFRMITQEETELVGYTMESNHCMSNIATDNSTFAILIVNSLQTT